MGRKGWHSRGYLPHMDGSEVVQHVVFRLADALPDDAPDAGDDVLDLGRGEAILKDAACARIVEETLKHFDGTRYDLKAWCVMPNHVHVLMATRATHETGAIVKSWKMFTTRSINAAANRTGQLWASDYFDRYIRDEDHFQTTKRYIEMNPVSAGLCATPKDWPSSSAARE